MSSIGDVAGLVVVIHDQNTMPFPEDEGITAHPGELMSIGVRRVSHQDSETVLIRLYITISLYFYTYSSLTLYISRSTAVTWSFVFQSAEQMLSRVRSSSY